MEYLLLLAGIFMGNVLTDADFQWTVTQTTVQEENVKPEENQWESTTENQNTEVPQVSGVNWKSQGEIFELPLQGATGFSVLDSHLKASADISSESLVTVRDGQSFIILKEEGDWWFVQLESGMTGWIQYSLCMINLPDVVPSMVYDNTNSVASTMKSFGLDIPSITGVQLYDVSGYNGRLKMDSFAMPVLYETAKKVAKAQELALRDGNTLIFVEGYRPYETQVEIVERMTEFLESNPALKEEIDDWGLEWFIATGVSSHQKGVAMDVSLGKVLETEVRSCGNYIYTAVKTYVEYEMPTELHELSPSSASMAYPINDYSSSWNTVPFSSTMNESAILLRDYCTTAGFTPLASEWWHFNDYSTYVHPSSQGRYSLDRILSLAPAT